MAQTCPACGAQSSGKFCSECGTPLGKRTCPKCGAELSARARFCSECGQVVATGPGQAPVPAGGTPKLPWIIAGVALLAVMATVIALVTRRGAPAQAPFAQGGAPTQGTTDISSMTPREAADRLFNRVMTAAENGDSSQVQFFGPMTIQAYGNVTPLDIDARLHVGSVELLLGDAAGARAQADTIARESRTHLFASLLRARAAEQQGDAAAARQQWGRFLDAYDAERADSLPEYGQHEGMLAQARDAAKRLLGR